MHTLHNKVVLDIANTIKNSLVQAFPDNDLTLEQVYQGVVFPPNTDMGHFAFPCFALAKTCKRSPNLISQTLVDEINKADPHTQVQATGPYLNFKLTTQYLGENVISKIIDNSFFEQLIADSENTIVIEYSQPNTHKELHVGHMRNLCLGNALVRIKQYCNQKVIPVTYIGDVGTHVAKCLWYLKYHNDTPTPESMAEKAEWLGQMYSKANLKLQDEAKGNTGETNKQQLSIILKQLEAKQGEFYQLWKETREYSLELMRQAYEWADVEFQRWYFESEEDSPSLELADKLYHDGQLEISNGAIGMDLSDDGLGFCMLVKSDGTGLYSTKDISLAYKKNDEFECSESIYIVDNRQALHFQQVFKVLENIGFEQADKYFHLKYEMVELTDGPMSSRKGNIVPLMELINQMENMIYETYLKKYQDKWSDDEIASTSKNIANAAIKYGMVRIDNNRKIIFDMAEWLRLDGETGPYLQYVVARINSLKDKVALNDNNIKYDVLIKKHEVELMLKLSHFNDVVLNCHTQNKTVTLTTYLFELGRTFNSFYAECSILNATSPELQQARMNISLATGKIIQQGLSLLGIKCPDRM